MQTVKKFLSRFVFYCAGHIPSSTPGEKGDASTIATVPRVRKVSESTVVINTRPISRSQSAATIPVYEAVQEEALREEISHLEDHISSGSPEVSDSKCVPRGPGPFQEVSALQSGSYGQAVVVRELGPSSGTRLLCLKVMDKNHIIERRASMGVLCELDAYVQLAQVEKKATSAFVMDLEAAMQDDTNLYLAMSLMSHDLLEEFGRDKEWRQSMAKKWVAQMVMGVSFIHDAGIIHRDIKPENILVDFRGNIRIADFGCAYSHEEWPLRPSVGYSNEITGTEEYMAPEMLDNKHLPKALRCNYGFAVDYWAVGCILFELVTEEAAVLFQNEDDRHRYRFWDKEIHDGLSYFSAWELDQHTEAVLEGLINFEPDERFTIKNLVEHPYFRDENGEMTFFGPFEGGSWFQPSPVFDQNFDSMKSKRVYAPSVKPPPNSEPFEDFGWVNPTGIWATIDSQVD